MISAVIVHVYAVKQTAVSLLKSLKRQGLLSSALLAIALLILTLIFALLAFAPILSPFIYPLF